MRNLEEGILSAHLHIEQAGRQHGANFDDNKNDYKIIDHLCFWQRKPFRF